MPPYLYLENDRVLEQPTAATPNSGEPDPSGAYWRGGPSRRETPGGRLFRLVTMLAEPFDESLSLTFGYYCCAQALAANAAHKII